MSIMKGKLRRSAVVVAFSLGAFQALSIVGANVASAAAVACTFNSGTLTVQFTGLGHTIGQDAAGNILVDGAKTSATVPTCTTSVDATTANTTQINVNGTPGARPDGRRRHDPDLEAQRHGDGELGLDQLDREPGRQRSASRRW